MCRSVVILALAGIVTAAPSPALANGCTEAGPSAADLDAIAHERKVKRVGIGMSLAGIGSEVATIAFWSATVGIISNHHDEYSSDPPAYWPIFSFAVATSVVAPLLLGIGIPMWSVAARRL
jgi:hypothetical protein